jgi:hypothetical protein
MDNQQSFRYGKIEDLDKSFDIEIWQKQGSQEIFKVAWSMVVDYYKFKGFDLNELRLHRTIENTGKLPS